MVLTNGAREQGRGPKPWAQRGPQLHCCSRPTPANQTKSNEIKHSARQGGVFVGQILDKLGRPTNQSLSGIHAALELHHEVELPEVAFKVPDAKAHPRAAARRVCRLGHLDELRPRLRSDIHVAKPRPFSRLLQARRIECYNSPNTPVLHTGIRSHGG
jgi:hypothetical protein